MAIETIWIASYKGPQSLSFSYYAHKSDVKDDKGPAGTVLEQTLRISVNGEPEYERKINALYPKEAILSTLKAGVESWKERQLGLDEVKKELLDLEQRLSQAASR